MRRGQGRPPCEGERSPGGAKVRRRQATGHTTRRDPKLPLNLEKEPERREPDEDGTAKGQGSVRLGRRPRTGLAPHQDWLVTLQAQRQEGRWLERGSGSAGLAADAFEQRGRGRASEALRGPRPTPPPATGPAAPTRRGRGGGGTRCHERRVGGTEGATTDAAAGDWAGGARMEHVSARSIASREPRRRCGGSA